MYNYPNYDMRNSNGAYQPTNGVYVGNEFYPEASEDRFFLAPFVVGGLAGTALGYGIANNNQINNQGMPCCGQPMIFIPQQPIYQQNYPQQPLYSSTSSNNFYY